MADRKSIPTVAAPDETADAAEFDKLLDAAVGDVETPQLPAVPGVVVGTLVGLTDNGATPLVTYPGQPGALALHARTTVDVAGPHIGRNVALMFESADPARPIIVGCLRGATDRSLPEMPGHVDVQADGERLVVSATRGLVLRCGKASITLSADGRIVVRGTHVVSHSSGVNRIKGGSVQVN